MHWYTIYVISILAGHYALFSLLIPLNKSNARRILAPWFPDGGRASVYLPWLV